MDEQVQLGFETQGVMLLLVNILPMKQFKGNRLRNPSCSLERSG